MFKKKEKLEVLKFLLFNNKQVKKILFIFLSKFKFEVFKIFDLIDKSFLDKREQIQMIPFPTPLTPVQIQIQIQTQIQTQILNPIQIQTLIQTQGCQTAPLRRARLETRMRLRMEVAPLDVV